MENKYIFMYIAHMVIQSDASPVLSEFQLKILLYSFPRLTAWTCDNLEAPFWRLYWNAVPGAVVRFEKKEYRLDPGFLTVITPDTPFGCQLVNPVEHLNIHFTVQSPHGAMKPAIIQRRIDPAFLKKIRLVCKRLRDNDTGLPLDIEVCGLVAGALDMVPLEFWPKRAIDSRIAAAIRYIEEHSMQGPENSEIAAQVGLSTGGFVRLFSRETGLSPRAFMQRRRLDRACLLLSQTGLSIDHIAEKCGFWDRNYFTKVFSKYKFLTPAAFRRQNTARK
jgi:AraC-like DNA-binding protein